MRLLKYFSYSNLDEQTNIFRCLHIKLLKESDPSLLTSISHIKKLYNIDDDIISLVETLNDRLKNYYKGNYRFGFTMDEGIPLNKIKLSQKIELKIRMQLFENNDKLAKLKRKIESQ